MILAANDLTVAARRPYSSKRWCEIAAKVLIANR
jgi:hypothetical protein